MTWYLLSCLGLCIVGRQSLYVDIIVNDLIFKTMAVQVEISLEMLVAHATSDIRRGDLINENNVEWEVKRLDRIASPLITPDDLTDLRAKTMIRAGSVLDRRRVETVPLVERNQMVELIFSLGGLRIAAEGRALARAGLDIDLVAVGHGFLGRVGRHANAEFLRFDFCGASDLHVALLM